MATRIPAGVFVPPLPVTTQAITHISAIAIDLVDVSMETACTFPSTDVPNIHDASVHASTLMRSLSGGGGFGNTLHEQIILPDPVRRPSSGNLAHVV